MDTTEIAGLTAACLTTFSFLPQAIHVIRTGDTRGLSLWMYLMFNAGVLLWLIYGIMLREIPIILANSVTLFLTIPILVLIIKKK